MGSQGCLFTQLLPDPSQRTEISARAEVPQAPRKRIVRSPPVLYDAFDLSVPLAFARTRITSPNFAGACISNFRAFLVLVPSFPLQVDGVKKATPLLLCLICIELSDFVFAVDSIPAVLGISHDTFIVYSSNVSGPYECLTFDEERHGRQPGVPHVTSTHYGWHCA